MKPEYIPTFGSFTTQEEGFARGSLISAQRQEEGNEYDEVWMTNGPKGGLGKIAAMSSSIRRKAMVINTGNTEIPTEAEVMVGESRELAKPKIAQLVMATRVKITKELKYQQWEEVWFVPMNEDGSGLSVYCLSAERTGSDEPIELIEIPTEPFTSSTVEEGKQKYLWFV